MKSIILFISAIILGSYLVKAQPIGCNNPMAGLTCEEAPVICNLLDLDGYCTTLPDFSNPTGPSPFCNGVGVSSNSIWFGFIGGSKNLSINIKPSNCTTVGGQKGIHGGIYTGDCGNVTSVICNGDCSTSMINLTTNNIISGKVYWFVMDGCNGSVCDITVDIISGSPPPVIGKLGPVIGPTRVCSGSTEKYKVNLVTGAPGYQWSFDNLADYCSPSFLPLDSNSIEIKFDSVGIYQVCVEVGSYCDIPQMKCLDITVEPGPPGIDPKPVKSCKHSAYIYNGKAYFPGQYNVKLQSYKGCDSIVTLRIDTLPSIHNDIGIQYKCNEGCITIKDTFGNGGVYCNPVDSAHVVLQSWTGCDSIVLFSIKRFDLNVSIDPPYDIGCSVNQTPLDGSNTLNNLANYDHLNIKWTALNGGKLQGPDDQFVTSTETGGKYCLTVEAIGIDGNLICEDSACVIVNKDPLSPSASIIGDKILCNIDSVILTGISSIPGSSYKWIGPNGEKYAEKNIKVAVPGTYYLTVTTPNFCSDTTSFELITEYKQKSSVEKDTLLCYGEVIQLNNDSLSAPNNYSFNALSNDTCFTYKYHIKLKNTEDQVFHICPGESFMMHNTLIDKQGVYEIHSQQPNGCDSIYYATVIEDPTNNTTTSVNVKMGSIYNGHLIINDTIVTDIFKNQFGCDSTVVTTVHVTTATNNLYNSSEISIVPNPAKNVINITSKQAIEIESYEIYNSIGQGMISKIQKTSLPVQLDISNLSDNMYLIKLKMKEGVVVKRFIKKE